MPRFANSRFPRGHVVSKSTSILVAVAITTCWVELARAEGPGQSDLDEATLTKINAQTMADLEKVVELSESAIKKGLDDGNEEYAKQLLTSTLYEHANRLSRLIFTRRPADPRWQRARSLALKSLQRALEYDENLGNAHVLIARLQALPGGDRERAREAVNKAIGLLKEDNDQLSTAHLVRAGLAENEEALLADFAQAIQLNPRNLDAWRSRALYHLSKGENEKALDDFRQLIEQDPDDLAANQAVAQVLRGLKQYDEALAHLEKVIQSNPKSPIPFVLQAQIFEEMQKTDDAIRSLGQALEVQPQDVAALMMRARLRTIQNNFDLAIADVESVLGVQPGLPQAILLRSVISASQGKFSDAIDDVRQLMRRNPENTELKIQLATYYEGDKRPSKAIEIYSGILKDDSDSWMAFRRRADALLTLGKHDQAVADYEAALKLRPDDSGILNNLAWVLATSPDENLRNGARAVELATKACEVTDYKQAHILSTLAAGHAEIGDFDRAIKWSTKAVELDKDEPQLIKELESYKAKKPWRELNPITEKPEPQTTGDAATETSDTG